MAKKQKFPATFDTEYEKGCMVWRQMGTTGETEIHPLFGWFYGMAAIYPNGWGAVVTGMTKEEVLEILAS